MNQVNLIGNLTKDPEMRYTPSGTAVTSFRLATNNGRDSEGKDREPDYHNIVVWGRHPREGEQNAEGLAGLCAQYLAKGSRVAIVGGRLTTNRWEDKEGTSRERAEVVLAGGTGNIEFLSPKEKKGES